MKKSIKIVIGIAVLILITWFVVQAVLSYYPYFLVGPPMPLFQIYNSDSSNHTVSVEIFDSNNKSMFKRTYILEPEVNIIYPEDVWEKGTWTKGEYMFKVTLDNKTTRTYFESVDTWSEVSLSIRNGELEIYTVVV